jgi:hypothetical protein
MTNELSSFEKWLIKFVKKHPIGIFHEWSNQDYIEWEHLFKYLPNQMKNGLYVEFFRENKYEVSPAFDEDTGLYYPTFWQYKKTGEDEKFEWCQMFIGKLTDYNSAMDQSIKKWNEFIKNNNEK